MRCTMNLRFSRKKNLTGRTHFQLSIGRINTKISYEHDRRCFATHRRGRKRHERAVRSFSLVEHASRGARRLIAFQAYFRERYTPHRFLQEVSSLL